MANDDSSSTMMTSQVRTGALLRIESTCTSRVLKGALVLLAIVFVGCGQESRSPSPRSAETPESSPPGLSTSRSQISDEKAAFIQKGDALCFEANKLRLALLGPQMRKGEVQPWGQLLGKMLPAHQQALDRLSELSPPAPDSQEMAGVLQAAKAHLNQANKVRQLGESVREGEFRRELEVMLQAGQDADRAARAFGFKECWLGPENAPTGPAVPVPVPSLGGF